MTGPLIPMPDPTSVIDPPYPPREPDGPGPWARASKVATPRFAPSMRRTVSNDRQDDCMNDSLFDRGEIAPSSGPSIEPRQGISTGGSRFSQVIPALWKSRPPVDFRIIVGRPIKGN